MWASDFLLSLNTETSQNWCCRYLIQVLNHAGFIFFRCIFTFSVLSATDRWNFKSIHLWRSFPSQQLETMKVTQNSRKSQSVLLLFVPRLEGFFRSRHFHFWEKIFRIEIVLYISTTEWVAWWVYGQSRSCLFIFLLRLTCLFTNSSLNHKSWVMLFRLPTVEFLYFRAF